MNTLTLRKIPLPLEKRLRRMAKESHQSINKTAVELLSKGAGVGPAPAKSRKYRDVLKILPKWTEKEYEEFTNNTRIFDTIDEAMWR